MGLVNCSKRQNLEEDRGLIQQELVMVGLSLEVPVKFQCDVYGQCVTESIRCLDCNVHLICCEQCEIDVHRHVLHGPEVWKVSK